MVAGGEGVSEVARAPLQAGDVREGFHGRAVDDGLRPPAQVGDGDAVVPREVGGRRMEGGAVLGRHEGGGDLRLGEREGGERVRERDAQRRMLYIAHPKSRSATYVSMRFYPPASKLSRQHYETQPG